MKKKIIVIGSVVILAAAGAVAALNMPETVNIDTAKRTDVEQSISITGNIIADSVETLYAPVSGRISDIAIKNGETIKENDIIATYDTTLIENEYEKASAALAATKQGYEAAVAENNNASGKYATAKAAEKSNRTELENVMAMLNALDIGNRDDYLEPGDYATSLDLEACIKAIETDTQIALTDKSTAESRLLEARSNERPYKEAYEDAECAVYAINETIKNTNPYDVETMEALKKQLEEAEAQRNLLKYRYDGVMDSIASAESDVSSATDKLYHDKEQLSFALAGLNDISKRNYDKTMSDEEYTLFKTLESRLEILQQDLSKNLSDRQLNESKLVNEHTIEQYQHNVDMAEVDVDNAQYMQDLAIDGIRANKGGIVLERFVDVNAVVDAGTPICTIQPVENIRAEVMISRFDIDRIAVGQSADITVGEKVYAGTVSKIFPIAQNDSSGKPKVKVWIDVDVSDNIPTIGLESQVVIHMGSQKSALSVPADGVYSDDQGDYVYLLENNQARKQYVQIGIKGNERYSVVDGVKEGNEVIVTPFSDEDLDGKYKGEKENIDDLLPDVID